MNSRARQHTVQVWSYQDMLFELYSYAPGPAESLPKHAHEEYQLCLSVDFPGEYSYRGTHYAVPTRSLSILHPGEMHAAHDLEERQRPTTFRVVYVNPTLLQTAATEVAGRTSSLPFFAMPIIFDADLVDLFLKFHVVHEVAASRLARDTLLLRVLTQCIWRYADTRPALAPLGEDRQRVQRVRAYLHDNYADNVSLDRLAQIANVSPYHLHCLFCKEVGLSPQRYQRQVRIARAKALLARAAVRIEQTYRTADRHHNPMEPSATIALWRDGKLTLYDATQWVWGVRMVVAAALDLPLEDVQVRAAFLGGGFGCKGYVWPHQILTAVAAREVGRPVKVVLTRAQTYTAHGYQPGSEQSVALGASRDGQLVAIRHTSVTPTSPLDDYVEYAAIGTRSLYACPAIATQHRAVRVHRGTPTPMRAPHEGLSMFGLECALDELAVQLGIDPVALRLSHYADTDPTSGKPFSSKALRACYLQGAERFGWGRRTPAPGSMRHGRDRLGWGMASAIMSTFRFPAAARVTLEKGGTALIEAGTQEIGTGVYTIMPQIAADVLGLPVERVRLVLGDTTLPETGGTFGSSTTMGVGSAVHDAATKLKTHLTQLASGKVLDSPAAYDEVLTHHVLDQLSAESAWSPGITVERLGLDAGARALSAAGAWSPGAHASPLGEVPEWSMHTFGAVFVEVRIDEDLCIPRLSRCVGIYSAGRIINPQTARSQMLGGMIWGLGQALLEHSAMDHTLGRYLSKNLSGYLVPVNADIPELEVDFVDEVDAHASTLGAKGIGELGAVGVGPAIANAVWHATGIRVRELPITPEMLLE